MLSFLAGNNVKTKKHSEDALRGPRIQHAKEMFYTGKFPVVTTPSIKGRRIKKVLGLVNGRGYDGEFSFYGLTASAIEIGADAIVGYQENVAFHPDGTKFYSCYGTAVVFEKDEAVKKAKPKSLKDIMH